MKIFEEEPTNFKDNYFDEESFFTLEDYKEFEEKEAILYFHKNYHRYEKLEKDFLKLSTSKLKVFTLKLTKTIHYEEKLQLWFENKLSPFVEGYQFKIEYAGKKHSPIATIFPKNELQRNLYLIYLIEHISGEYVKNNEIFGAEIYTYQSLVEHFNNSKGNIKKEKEDIIQKCRQIKIDHSLSVEFIDYVDYLKSMHKNLSSFKIEKLDRIKNFWALAIELSFYYNYAKYYLFLDSVDSGLKDKNRYLIEEENKTFKTAEYFDDAKLLKLHNLLVKEKYISEIEYEDFKKVFTETEIKNNVYRHKKIDWKIKNKGMDKQALLTLIDYVVSPKYSEQNIKTIRKIIGACFTFENRDISENLEKSFGETFKSFKDKNFKNSKKIDEIMDRIF